MIPKASIDERAQADRVLPTTVDKDYVLGWLLYGIAAHPYLSQWVFKGGTCLKKCFFETYRFSEDLDFTIPRELELSLEHIRVALKELGSWVQDECGIEFPDDGLDVEKYSNKQGTDSFRARQTYTGPYPMRRRSQQRVKFDITQHEVIVGPVDHRQVVHGYEDARAPTPRVSCYSVNEILAEKTRALYERRGRARDVYDVVHISRSLREDISPTIARRALLEKFAFKKLEAPTATTIFDRVEWDALESNWDNQLRHQLPELPALDGFKADLMDALVWWMDPPSAAPALASVPLALGDERVPRTRFPRGFAGPAGELADAIVFAARNRLLATFDYHGDRRVVEPYSLRRKRTGDLLLFAFEVSKSGTATMDIRSYKVVDISGARAIKSSFSPRWHVEL